MDTRFWGPDGWHLLHSIAYTYPSNPNKTTRQKYKRFFNTVPYILPCVYCRNSLHKFYKDLPIENSLQNNNSLFEWLYKIHNKVNNKLTKQNLNCKTNPGLSKIRKFYKKYVVDNDKSCSEHPGILFIYSIIFNYPLSKSDFITNIRFNKHITFLKLLAELYPFDKFKKPYKKIILESDLKNILIKRCHFKRWFYTVDKTINNQCPSYKKRCEYMELYRANCKKKTCRKKT
uniref:thiol oxidase n=1 Tax=viral metagenome TaxID=1070528 RepID=A0A6C0B4L9_9ZZZZ